MVDKKDIFVGLLPKTLDGGLLENYSKTVIKEKNTVKIFPRFSKKFGITLNTIIISEQNLNTIISKEKGKYFKPLLKERYAYSWDIFLGYDKSKLCAFLEKEFNIKGLKPEDIQNNDAKTISISKDTNKIEIKLDDKKERATLKSWDKEENVYFEKRNGEIRGIDHIDFELFSKSPFGRSIYKSNKYSKIKFHTTTINFYLFLNLSKLEKLNNCYLNTFTLTTFGAENNDFELSNKDVINLSKWCVKTFKDKTSFDDLFNDNGIPIDDDVDSTNVDDTFRSIQFWNNGGDYKDQDDARNIIKKDIAESSLNSMYYFFSILTHDYMEGLLRRHYKNIFDIMGCCQSTSIAYFDVFYGNVCLEVTIKPKGTMFKQIGHDSEEFRIWEILALQKFIVTTKELEPFKDLEDFFDFRAFTKKLEKGGSWIHYANYLKEVTKIEYYYNIRKNEYEFRERQMENKLQKLNYLLIVSIFISLVTFFLSPVYSESVKNESIPFNLYSIIFTSSYYIEGKAILLASSFTVLFWLIIMFPKKLNFKKEDILYYIAWFALSFYITYIFFYIYYK